MPSTARRHGRHRGTRISCPQLFDRTSKSVGVRSHSRGRVLLQLECLPGQARPLWLARRAALCIQSPARPSRDTGYDGARVRSQPSGRRGRIFPACALCAVALGDRSRQPGGSSPGDLLLSPVGNRSAATASQRCGAESSLSPLPQSEPYRAEIASTAERFPLGPDGSRFRS